MRTFHCIDAVAIPRCFFAAGTDCLCVTTPAVTVKKGAVAVRERHKGASNSNHHLHPSSTDHAYAWLCLRRCSCSFRSTPLAMPLRSKEAGLCHQFPLRRIILVDLPGVLGYHPHGRRRLVPTCPQLQLFGAVDPLSPVGLNGGRDGNGPRALGECRLGAS